MGRRSKPSCLGLGRTPGATEPRATAIVEVATINHFFSTAFAVHFHRFVRPRRCQPRGDDGDDDSSGDSGEDVPTRFEFHMPRVRLSWLRCEGIFYAWPEMCPRRAFVLWVSFQFVKPSNLSDVMSL